MTSDLAWVQFPRRSGKPLWLPSNTEFAVLSPQFKVIAVVSWWSRGVELVESLFAPSSDFLGVLPSTDEGYELGDQLYRLIQRHQVVPYARIGRKGVYMVSDFREAPGAHYRINTELNHGSNRLLPGSVYALIERNQLQGFEWPGLNEVVELANNRDLDVTDYPRPLGERFDAGQLPLGGVSGRIILWNEEAIAASAPPAAFNP